MTNSDDDLNLDDVDLAELDGAEAPDAADKSVVLKQVDEIRDFVGGLSMDDIKSGDWFARLLKVSLAQYSEQVTAEWFREKYPHLPADAIVDARIKLAAKYAGIEGGLSAAAYTGAVAATIGSLGGASPLTAPAAVGSFVVDLAYTTRLQLRLAHDIAVLYGVPIDVNDSEDLWKIIRIALLIKSGEAGRGAVSKGVPVVLRPVIKKIFSGSTLTAVKSLPVVGKHLLQRNIIKFSIPGVTVPLSTAINYWTTKSAGDYARSFFRTQAQITEIVGRMMAKTPHHEELLWATWLVIQADGKVAEEEKLLLHHVTSSISDRNPGSVALVQLRETIDADEAEVLAKFEALDGDLQPLYECAVLVAGTDGKTGKDELAVLDRLAEACRVESPTHREATSGRDFTAVRALGGRMAGRFSKRKGERETPSDE
ncbi:hypothetical protein H7F30_14050 [Dermacoccus sp. PAMC28757]|uniref:TerB family tellurite resistance protein n=1 Tax=Dermacoccus sp. PAMC28757 TaxID=2762331 RepID=UPI00164CE732|nr:TerB family tellurite resistance protein [Dermacoccus sp. PAMC28757]QNK52664.1 hypothetical protein H7F30_14050 [Dermacoccus sp. PAMC28757]